MYKKAANTQLIASMILILTAILFGMMLLNVGNRFVNQGAIYSKYHLMESSYIFQTMYMAPSSVVLRYDFDLTNFNFNFDDNKYYVELTGFESDEKTFTRDKTIDIDIGPFSRPNFFLRTSRLVFSNKQGDVNNILCPNKNTFIQNPIILIGILNNENSYNSRLMSYYNIVYEQFSKGTVYFKDFNEDYATPGNNISIIVSDFNDDKDIIIYYKPNLRNAKLGCLVFNKINEINFNEINIVLAPSNEIYSDLQINLNFDSDNLGTRDVEIPFKLNDALGVFFK